MTIERCSAGMILVDRPDYVSWSSARVVIFDILHFRSECNWIGEFVACHDPNENPKSAVRRVMEGGAVHWLAKLVPLSDVSYLLHFMADIFVKTNISASLNASNPYGQFELHVMTTSLQACQSACQLEWARGI